MRSYLAELRRPVNLLLALFLLGVIGVCGYWASLHWRADSHLRAAERALKENDFGKARAHLLLCLEAWPDRPDVHLLLARTARRAEAYGEASTHLGRCEECGGIPELITLERMLQRVQQADFAGVEPVLWKYVRADHADKILILEALARGYMTSFRLPQALDALDLWIKEDPDNAQAFFWRGETLDHFRLYKDARHDYERALELDPTHEPARLYLANSLRTASDAKEALKHYEYLRQRLPGSTDVVLGLAACKASLGDSDEALGLLEKLVADFPSNAAAWIQLGKVVLDADQPAKAEPCLRRGHELAPYDREGTYNLMQCLQRLGKDADVVPVVKRLEEISVTQKRLQELTANIRKAPRDAGLRCEIGEIFLKMRDEKEALRWMQSALQENPTHADTHRALRDFFRSRGDERLAAYHDRFLEKR